MLVKTKEVKEVEATRDVICNRCGESCKVGESNPPSFQYVELQVEWGYYSKKDLESHKSHICEKCYDAIVKEFKVIPDKRYNITFF